MRNDDPLRATTWRRHFWHSLITVLGIGVIVGSGGGSVGYPSCGPPLCSSGPIVPLLAARLAPPDVTVQVGSAASFVVLVENADAPSYQWRRSYDGGATYNDLAGATGSSLTLPAVNLADDGARLQVRVSSAGGQQTHAFGYLHVSATPGVVIADGEFQPADWVFSPVLGPAPAPAASSAERVGSGGNPGAWLRLQVQVPQGAGSARVTFLSATAIYAPRLTGAIAAIDYAEDCIAVLPSDTAGTNSWLALEQAGRHYVANNRSGIAACYLAGWRPVAPQGRLMPQDFTFVEGPACQAGEACPDFSTGAPGMRFGFARQSFATPGQSVVHGIDNWKVTVWRR